MLQLEPSEYFPITRQLDDPQLTGTYYVRAYVRNSKTNTLLTTINLTDQGSYRFTSNYQVPSDAGSGTYIDIETRVFIDATYATESDSLGRKLETYLIQSRWNQSFGRGGGTDISYEKIKKIVEDVIKGSYKETDLRPVLDAINSIEVSPVIKTEKVDIGGLARIIERVGMDVRKIPQPKDPKDVDLNPILEKINVFGNELAKRILGNFSTGLKEILANITTIVSSDDELRDRDKKDILEAVKKMKIIINSSGETGENRTLETPEKPKKIRKLLGRYA